MTTDSTTTVDDATLFLGEAWSDPIEAGIRDRIRGFIEELIEEELAAALGGTNAGVRADAMANRARPTARRPPRRPMSRRLTVTGTVIASDGSPARDRRDRRAAGADRWRGRVGARVEEQGVAPLRPHDPAGGGADRRDLSGRHQYPTGAPGAGGAVQGGDRQGRGQPHLAEGEDGLGSLVEAPARRGGHRPADPRRHRRARPARQEGDIDLAAGCPRRPASTRARSPGRCA